MFIYILGLFDFYTLVYLLNDIEIIYKSNSIK